MGEGLLRAGDPARPRSPHRHRPDGRDHGAPSRANASERAIREHECRPARATKPAARRYGSARDQRRVPAAGAAGADTDRSFVAMIMSNEWTIGWLMLRFEPEAGDPIDRGKT